jgi:hypothetical protein
MLAMNKVNLKQRNCGYSDRNDDGINLITSAISKPLPVYSAWQRKANYFQFNFYYQPYALIY